jgi:NhaA family Na+:H+ antiporter
MNVFKERAAPPITLLVRPFKEFTQIAASGGILLLLCTVVALAWANSPWADSYFSLWQTKLIFGLGDLALSKPLLLWINDALMAIFFFVVGLEIKREVLIGELSSFRNAVLPISAAIGGMIVPASLYLAFNFGTEGARGWGIPMATDIAFALGVLALLGQRVPLQLKIFLTALAIVDDIGAVMVIAFFYTAELSWLSLGIGLVFLLAMFAANLVGVRQPVVYLLLGMALWVAVLKSGIHATIAGVLSAMAIPARARIEAQAFLSRGRALLDQFERSSAAAPGGFISEEQQTAVSALETACENVETPLQRLEHDLHLWVTFAIMPVFALANAGVALRANVSEIVTGSVSLGIIAGLVIGKQVGVTLFAWLAVRSGFTALPAGVTWGQIYGAGWLAGIGFTMSLFIAGLGFSDDHLLSAARLGILVASLLAGVAGWLILLKALPDKAVPSGPGFSSSSSKH